jgi:hypothetical protein
MMSSNFSFNLPNIPKYYLFSHLLPVLLLFLVSIDLAEASRGNLEGVKT